MHCIAHQYVIHEECHAHEKARVFEDEAQVKKWAIQVMLWKPKLGRPFLSEAKGG